MVVESKEKLKDEITTAAAALLRNHFHEASGTYIVHLPGIGPFGVKGFGNFPDEAFSSFRCSLRLTLEDASEDLLDAWSHTIDLARRRRRNEERVSVATLSCSGRIAVNAPKRLHEQLNVLASRRGLAYSKYCSELIARNLGRIDEALETTAPATVREELVAEQQSMRSRFGSKKTQRSVHIDRLDHARLLVLAQELSIKPSDLVRSIMFFAIRQQPSHIPSSEPLR